MPSVPLTDHKPSVRSLADNPSTLIGSPNQPISFPTRAQRFAASIRSTPIKRRHPPDQNSMPNALEDHTYTKKRCYFNNVEHADNNEDWILAEPMQ